jgi:CDP-diacylglycerol--glycerol-3-phosphate 3-phosphatidyltransferase
MTFNTTPNILTLVRILVVPIVVAALFVQTRTWDLVAGWLFSAAAITDYFDGYLARTQKIETVYGKLMDPLADKFLVVSALIMLQHIGRVHPVVVILLICREMAITSLRALASAEGIVVAASQGGKWKTAAQMFAIPFIMAKPSLLGLPTYQIGFGLLYLSLGMSLWSAKDYIIDVFRAIRANRKVKVEERKAARAARREARMARFAAKAAAHSAGHGPKTPTQAPQS